MQAVDSLCKSGDKHCLTLENRCMYAATQSPAKRYYVTAKHALAVFRLYEKNGNLKWMSPRIRCMFHDLFSDFKLRKIAAQFAERQTGKHWFDEELMDAAIKQPAPSFYLEPKSALNYYYRALNNKRKQHRK